MRLRRTNRNSWHINPDRLTGGRSEGHTEDEFDPRQLAMGEKIEMEHTRDPKIARQIAMDHLVEMADYYTWLRAMEILAEQEKKKPVRENPPESIVPVEPWEFYERAAKHVRRYLPPGKGESAQDVVVDWMANEGQRDGIVDSRGQLRRQVDRRQLASLLNQLLYVNESKELAGSLVPALVREQRRLRQEVESGGSAQLSDDELIISEGDESGSLTIPISPAGLTGERLYETDEQAGPVDYEGRRAESVQRQEKRLADVADTVAVQIRDRLNQGQPREKLAAAIATLHWGLGKPTGRWATEVRIKGSKVMELKTRRDYQDYHFREGVCPTCRAISRQLSVQGLTPDAVKSLFTRFMTDVSLLLAKQELAKTNGYRSQNRHDVHQGAGKGRGNYRR